MVGRKIVFAVVLLTIVFAIESYGYHCHHYNHKYNPNHNPNHNHDHNDLTTTTTTTTHIPSNGMKRM